MVEAMTKSLGNVSISTKEVGIARTTHYEWYNEDKEYKQQIDDIENITIDFVENALLKNVMKGDNTAIIFYLKCKAKHKGYVERTEHVVQGDITNRNILLDFKDEYEKTLKEVESAGKRDDTTVSEEH